MTTYCQCGAKNTYAAVKPKNCESCGGPLETKSLVREKPVPKRRPGYDPIEVDEEGIGEEETYNPEAVRRSIRLEPDGNEGGFMKVTAEWARHGAGGRGEAPKIDVRDDVLNGLLSGKGLGKPTADMTPPADFDKPRSQARLQPNRLTPPAE